MEFNQELIDKEWQAIFDREAYYLSLLKSKQDALLFELPTDGIERMDSSFWDKKIALFNLDTQIKATKHYIESAQQDKAQQDAYREAVKKAIDEKNTAIMAKARRCIDGNTDRKPVLEALLKDMPEAQSPQWYKRMQEINEHTNVAQMPTTKGIPDLKIVQSIHK